MTFGGQCEEAARSQQGPGLPSILALAGMYGPMTEVMLGVLLTSTFLYR